MSVFETSAQAAEALRGLCGGAVHLPGDPGYDAARMPWNVAVDQRPAAVAYPAETAEVVAVVKAAAAAGLRVAPQGTGHNAGPLDGRLDDVVLLRTSAMTGVTVDAEAGLVRVQAGTLWLDVVEAASRHDVSVLHGSSPDVGVVGYSLGGGMGWYARALGLQCNAVTGAEVVLADGSVVRADASTNAELFWAIRGGGGNFGIVTELEFRCFPFTTAYAGMMVWDWSHAREVLRTWTRWSTEAPHAVTTSLRLLQLPPLPQLPELVRGRNLVVIDGAVLGDDAEAERLLAPLRALAPEADTFGRVPSSALVRLHMDPEGPTPGVGDTAVLAALPDEAVDALLTVAGPGSGSTLLSTELRQLGGALRGSGPGSGALAAVDGQFVLFGAGIAATAEMAAAARADCSRLVQAMTPWTNGRHYLNFVEADVDASAGYRPEDWARLSAARTLLDPHGLFVANHAVPSSLVPEQWSR